MAIRILRWLAFTFAALAAGIVVSLLPALRAAGQLGNFHGESDDFSFVGHDVYIRIFGLPWWLPPVLLTGFAVALFAWSMRLGKRRRNE
jgi:hypothetical protein